MGVVAEMTAAERKLLLAMRYYRSEGSSASGVRELALAGASRLVVQRTLLPSIRMSALPFRDVAVLDLSRNRLGPHAFSCLLYAVAGAAPTLKVLDVSHNMASAECSNSVAVLLRNNATLEKLVISDNPLTTCIGDDLGRALRVNRTLRTLEMEAVGLMDGSTLFAGMSAHPGLTALNVSRNSCGPKAWVTFGQSMTAGIALKSLQARSTDIGKEGAPAVAAAIRSQKVTQDLDVSGCNLGFSEVCELFEALSTCPAVRRVAMAHNKLKGGSLGRSLAALCNKADLDEVDLSNCELSDESFKSCMAAIAGGRRLATFSFAGNNLGGASGAALKSTLVKMYKADKRPTKVAFSGNNIDQLLLSDFMAEDYDESEGEGGWLPNELEISDSKATPEVLETLAQIFENAEGADAGKCPLQKLRLDGVNLGKPPGLGRLPRGAPVPAPIIAKLLAASAVTDQLTAVTLHNAQLKDAGASFLAGRINSGWRVVDLDLGMNEIGDAGCTELANSLVSTCGNNLTRLQMRLNKCRNDGALALAKALGDTNCKLKFLSLASNVIGTVGLKALMQAIGSAHSLESLDCENQKEAIWKEEDFTLGAKHLADALSKRSLDSPGLSINLSKIEGMGMASAGIDCTAVVTDYSANHKISTLGLQDVLDISSAMRGPLPLNHLEEMWGGFGTAPGNSPSWLASAEMRARAVHVAHLQISITKDRITDWFESEADADVQDLFMCADKGLKTPNGFAWILFKSASSVDKSIKLYEQGRAAIYGSPFIISTIETDVDSADFESCNIETELAQRACAESARKAQERSDVDEAHARALEKQKNQKAAYGGSDMGMSHANTLGGQNCVKTLDDGKPW